ncbi:MAG TPA: ABC transporter ATP-binding protein, partial [Kofleriaceae bacterium]|nr:ABC transporter ATP-binding protein [Kofleriaceae bacterium]
PGSPSPAPATLGESAAPPRQNRLLPNQERWPLDPQKPVIELDNVSIAFGGRPVLSGLSLQIVPGKTTVIVGRSGSGKSVLLKLMMGLLRPHSGKVIAFGRDLTKVSQLELLELRKRMGMLFQNYALFDALSVEDNVGFPLRENSRLPQREISTLSRELINILGLGGSEHLLPAELSGGMKKRVSLARALVFNPEVVLFDEPTTGLDPIMIEKVDEMIALASKRYQITSVIISHDMASTARLADRVAFLHEGKIVFLGSYQEFRACTLPPVQSFVAGAQTSRLAAEEVTAPAAALPEGRPSYQVADELGDDMGDDLGDDMGDDLGDEDT